jgi:hypothetical protein
MVFFVFFRSFNIDVDLYSMRVDYVNFDEMLKFHQLITELFSGLVERQHSSTCHLNSAGRAIQ